MASLRHVAAWCIMRMLAVWNRKTLAERHFVVTVTAAEMLRPEMPESQACGLQAFCCSHGRRPWRIFPSVFSVNGLLKCHRL